MTEEHLCRLQDQWGRRCPRHQSRYSPAAHEEDHGDLGWLPAAHRGPHWSRYPHCIPSKTPCCPEGSRSLWEVHVRAGFLAGTVAYWEPRLEQSIPHELYRMERNHVGAGLELEGPTLEQFMKDCIPWEGPHDGAEEKSEEEGVSETKYYELTATLLPQPLRCSGEGGGRVRGDVEPRKKGGWGDSGFWGISHYATLLLMGNKLINFPQVSLFCP